MSLESSSNNRNVSLTNDSSVVAHDLKDFDVEHGIKDITTPKNVPLSGQYNKSFAYHTFRHRLPTTFSTVLRTLEQSKNNNEFPHDLEELNSIIENVKRLKQQLENNGQLEMFEGNEPDKEVWNSFIASLSKDQCTIYKTCWLYGECYLYRKLASYFEATKALRDYDVFAPQKLQALKVSTKAMIEVAKSTKNLECNIQTFQKLLKLNLWGNRCDLSITCGKEVKPTDNLLEIIDSFNNNILVDHSELIWNSLQRSNDQASVIIDFICDNAGFELFTDLLLAEYLLEHRLADTVRFHIKAVPWFVSDTTIQDVRCTLKYFQEHNESLELNRLGNNWSKYFENGRFQLPAVREDFWTSPFEYNRLAEINPSLYKTLQESSLLIFKGDLNYRKLLGDFNWDFCEKFETCLRGFRPANLCTLRTVKGDLICNLKPGQAEELSKQNPDWMFTGEYGLIKCIVKQNK